MAFKDRFYDVPVVGTALRVQDRYADDAADQYAAAIGFFGFLSLFPLMIIAVAVAGFVLRGDPAAQAQVVTAITDSIPGFAATLEGASGESTSIATALDSVSENAGAIGLVGLVTLLLSGLRVVNAAMTATTRVFRVPLPTGVKGKLRQLGALALLGLLALAGAAAGASVGVTATGVFALAFSLLTTLLSVLLDLALFLAAYRMLAAGHGPGYRRLLPGAILAAVAWTALKVVGATLVASQASDANALYGALGGVIGLLLLFYLAGRLYLYGAELSALLAGIDATPGPAARIVTEEVDMRTPPVRQEVDVDPPARDDERDAPPTAPVTSGGARSGPAAPADPGPGSTAPTVGEQTRRRVAGADERRALEHTGPDVRGTLAFGIAVTVVGLLVRAGRPWGADT